MKQYQFSLKDECMKELPSIKEPKKFAAPESLWSDTQLDIYYGNLHEYKKHLTSLQSIPVPKEYLSLFTDGKIYNEDEFYIQGIVWDIKNGCELKNYGNKLDWTKYEVRKVAIPKQKIDDTELHFLNLGFEIKFIKNELLPANTAMVSKDIYEMLKNNYQK